jgi:DTW domain-containing protein YfiP
MNEPDPARCPQCDKPQAFCVCALVTPQRVRTRVLVAQHPREQDRDLGTAPLLRAFLGDRCELRVGLSWASFAQLVDDDRADPKRWAVLYPHSLHKPLTPAQTREPAVFLDRAGDPLEPGTRLEGVVILDGTWSQAKALWWRNAWMLKLGRAVLHPKEPSIYGRLRREPRREALSTLESAAEVLVANGEPEAVRAEMRRVFRTMMQRARDYYRDQPLPAASGGADD